MKRIVQKWSLFVLMTAILFQQKMFGLELRQASDETPEARALARKMETCTQAGDSCWLHEGSVTSAGVCRQAAPEGILAKLKLSVDKAKWGAEEAERSKKSHRGSHKNPYAAQPNEHGYICVPKPFVKK